MLQQVIPYTLINAAAVSVFIYTRKPIGEAFSARGKSLYLEMCIYYIQFDRSYNDENNGQLTRVIDKNVCILHSD